MAVYGSWVNTLITSYLTGATIKALLVSPAYSQNHANQFRSDLTSEVVGTGYAAGGVALTGVVITEIDGMVKVDCDDVAFGVIDVGSIAGIVFYVDNGSAAADRLLSSDVLEVAIDTTGNTLPFTYAPSSDGILIGDYVI